jgi:hypothetical protein
MFADLKEAGHIVAGMNVSLREALEIVRAAKEPAEPPVSNIIYGVVWGSGKPKTETRGSL